MLSIRQHVVFLLLFVSVPVFGQVTIDSIEINQAIGVQKDGHLKFVAGKDAVVRAFLAAPAVIDEGRTHATIKRGGQVIATIPPIAVREAVGVVDFLCPTRATCGNWAAGSYQFDVTVNGATKSTRGTKYEFVERAVLRILAVPVTANYGGTVVPLTDSKWKTFSDYIRATYPVAADKVIWATREPFDASDRSFDLETEEGQEHLWDELAKLVPESCAGNPEEAGCYTQVFGFIQARPEVYPNGTLQGFTYGMPANIGVATDDDAPGTVAHEIGHTYGLGDTYDGGGFACDVNPAPDEFRGTNLSLKDEGEDEPEDAEIACAQGRVPLEGVSATKIPAAHHPYEVGGRGALPDSAEFMGSRGTQDQFWTSQDVYDHLFDQLAPQSHAKEAKPHRYVQCFGSIHRDAKSADDVRVEPCWTFDDRDSIPGTTGEYELAALDANGSVLATTALKPEFDPAPPKGRKSKHLAWGAFEGVLPFAKDVAKLQIRRGRTVLRELPVSSHAPVVRKVAPEAKGRVRGKLTFTWDANDADANTRLVYQVDYNAGSRWEVVRRDLSEKQFTIDFAAMPGGPHAKLRVWASDGILSSSAESAEFSVTAKAPQVVIEPLPNNGVYRAGDDIILDGDATDLQDEEINESQLRWSADGRSLGRGTPLKISHLKPGKHTIKLAATNSRGKTGSATVTVSLSAAVVPDAEIRSILNDRVGDAKGVGIVVGIIDPHGQRIVSAGGFDGKTLFEIGSVEKVFTALLLSEMAERGEVKLTDRAANDLPITFADLATHTSGLPFMPPDGIATRTRMYEYLRRQPARGGAAWDYSNLGYWLLGDALAARMHTDFDTLLRRRILDPMKLRDTTTHLTPAQTARVAPGYDASLNPAAPWSSMPAYSMMSAAGMGWYSSADDLLAFLAFALDLRRSPLQPAMIAMLNKTRPASSPATRQALGWLVEGSAGDRLIVHDGGTLGYAASVAWDPKLRTGVVVLSNQFGDVGDIARHLLRPSVPLHKPTSAKQKEVALPPAMLASYAGKYEAAGEGVFVIELGDGRLTIEAPSDWGLPKLQLHPSSEREFFVSELPLRVVFETKDSDVTKIVVYPPRGQKGVAAARMH